MQSHFKRRREAETDLTRSVTSPMVIHIPRASPPTGFPWETVNPKTVSASLNDSHQKDYAVICIGHNMEEMFLIIRLSGRRGNWKVKWFTPRKHNSLYMCDKLTILVLYCYLGTHYL